LFGLILVGLLVPVWLPFFLPAVYLWEALTAANVHSLLKIIGCFSLCVVEAQALGFGVSKIQHADRFSPHRLLF